MLLVLLAHFGALDDQDTLKERELCECEQRKLVVELLTCGSVSEASAGFYQDSQHGRMCNCPTHVNNFDNT